jgi:hypothetical protein
MPIRSAQFPGERSITDTWYTAIQIDDLGKTWQNEGNAEDEVRYFAPNLNDLTPEFLRSLPRDKPAKFMFYTNVGGGHWIGCGVIVRDGEATVALADSLHPEDKYEGMHDSNGDKRVFVEEIASQFENAFGAVTKKTYEHTWTQTNWKGDKEESPNSCGPYTVENMRRFLADSQDANMQINPGGRIIREQQLARMTNSVGIRVASDSDVLMSIAREFSKANPGVKFTNNDLRRLLQDPNFCTEIAYQRNISVARMNRLTDPGFDITTAAPPNSVEAADKSEAEGIIAAMNRTLDKVRGVEKQKEELLAALQNLQGGMGAAAFKHFVENDFKVWAIGPEEPYVVELITAQSALPNLTPQECDGIIRENFPDINPPFVRIEDAKLRLAMQEADVRLAKGIQQQEEKERDERVSMEEMKSRPLLADEIAERIKEIREELPELRKEQQEYEVSNNPFKPNPGHTKRIVELKEELNTLSSRLRQEKEKLRKEVNRPRSRSLGSEPDQREGGKPRSRSL